ncbi:T9SS type A sorting domain-containing protein [Flavobacterium sp.]|uniref:T9SS type A sorting domain-containing protein n=1 Tax=Flavobacterium sp. TaxID=239 RepID=UPI002635BA48|nr:T9SS type A sorting domain-containing protein [Flavobacterium sp.]
MKILFFILIHCLSFSQAPSILWQNKIGGINDDFYNNSDVTIDDGLIIGGRSTSNISGDKTENSKGGSDYWIVKINHLGNVVWDKTIGGGNPNFYEDDVFTCLKSTLDGGYIIGGHSDSPISGDKTIDSFDNSDDFWILKLNEFGIIQWQKVFGGSLVDVPTAIKNTFDNGFVIVGYSDSNISGNKTENSKGLIDIWILKLDSLGNIVWQKTIGGTGFDSANCVVQTNDGGFLIGGDSTSNISGDKTEDSRGLRDFWIVKINSLGDLQWQKTIGGNNVDYLLNIISKNNNFVLIGSSKSNISGEKLENSRGGYDCWIMEIDSLGTILWQKTIGGNGDDYFGNIISTNDSNYIISGSSSSNISAEKTEDSKGGFDAWILKIDSFGNILWQKTIGGSDLDGLEIIDQPNDNSFLLSGSSNSFVSGEITENPIGGSDYWVLKLEPENLSNQENNSFSNIQIYPNPNNGILNIDFGGFQETISISITNVLGQLISKYNFNQISEKQIQLSEPNGIYFLEIRNEKNEKKVFKILKQ